MKLEEVSAENIKNLSDVALRSLRNRFCQVYTSKFEGRRIQKHGLLTREKLIGGYTLLRREMLKRHMLNNTVSLDHLVMKRVVFGVDTHDLPVITVKSSFVSLAGEFVEAPLTSKSADVVVSCGHSFAEEIKEPILKSLGHLEKQLCYMQFSPAEAKRVIPIYKLALVPHDFTQRIEVKPDTNFELYDNLEKRFSAFSSRDIPIFRIGKKEEEQIVCGIVYAPYEVDAQDDYTTPEEIRKAAYYFMENAMRFGHNHGQDTITWAYGLEPLARPLESYIAPVDFDYECPDGSFKSVAKGSWVLISRIINKDLWNGVKTGEITGYSMGGKARRLVA